MIAELRINGVPCSWDAFVNANTRRDGGPALIEAVRKLAVGETLRGWPGTGQSTFTVLAVEPYS